MGPIALFDKSFLQSLSVDESVWFDHLYGAVVCPLFFAETLADLAKTPRDGKAALDEVAVIASKTPEWSGTPCYYHQHLCTWDLLGNAVPMTGQVPVAARSVMHADGRLGAVSDYPPEAEAFARWNKRQFLATEYLFARDWRERIRNTDLNSLRSAMKSRGIGPKTCKTLEDARRYAEWCVTAASSNLSRFESAMQTLGVPDDARAPIRNRWKHAGRQDLRSFAPYAAHVLCVEAFFAIGIAAHLIAAERPSNRIDVAYLFYLPFCNLFVSGDRLHRGCAPHFLRKDQEFLWAHDLKADLQSIDAHFKAQPDVIRALPIYNLLKELSIPQGITSRLTDKFAPGRSSRDEIDLSRISPESHQKLLQEMKGWQTASQLPNNMRIPEEALEGFSIQRLISKQRGSWTQVGPEVPDTPQE
jgi:hypothetical protein